MKLVKNYLLCLIFILTSCGLFGQQKDNGHNKVIFGSFHMTNYWNENSYIEHSFVPGFSIEYRENIDSLSYNFHLSLGLAFESAPVKFYHIEGFTKITYLNYCIPFGLNYSIGKSSYLGVFTSLDFPIAEIYEDFFVSNGDPQFEFTFRFLNINFSGGMNFGRIIHIKDKVFRIELHGKVLGLLGLKSNDYWHYPQVGGNIYYYGIRIGYGF